MPTASFNDITRIVPPEEAPSASSEEVIQKPASDDKEAEGAPQERHEWSSTQFNLPDEIAAAVQQFGASIPDGELAEDGREDEIHCTLLYGVDTEDQEVVRSALSGMKPITIKIGKLSLFENDDADVLKLDIDSPQLVALNRELRGLLPHVEKQADHVPHATVAYVKPGDGEKYAGKSVPGATGKRFKVDVVTFSSKDGSTTDIPLGESAPSKPTEKPASREAPQPAETAP